MATNPGAARRECGGTATARRIQETPSLGWMLLLAAALFALVLPVVGPLDDHHFAERAHNHDHIYLNGAPVGHNHAYQERSEHAHPEMGRASSPADRIGIDGDVRFLAQTTTGLMLAALTAPYHPAPESLRPPPPSGSRGNLLQRFSPQLSPARGLSVPPPLQPPIV